MNLPYSFDPEAAYDLVPLEGDLGLTSRIIVGSLFIARRGTLDQVRAWDEIREQTPYLTGTPIVIGRLLGAILTLTRTQATFKLVPIADAAERPSSPA